MIIAIAALMIITSLGIYGYLAKGHLEQQTPLAPIELQINQKQSQIDLLNADISSQKVRLTQMDSAVNSLIGNDKAEKGLKYRYSQRNERKQAQDAINLDNTKIQQLTTELVPLKLKINEVETKLGPLKYVAQLFGFKDTDFAVRMVILIIMTAFDPLAIMLVISSIMTISEAFETKRQEKYNNANSITLTKEQHNSLLFEIDAMKSAIVELEKNNLISMEELQKDHLYNIEFLNSEHVVEIKNLNSELDSLKSEHSNIIKNYNTEIDRLIWARDTAQVELDNIKNIKIENIYDILSNPEFIKEPEPELELESQKEITDKDLLIEILQRKPDLLQLIVDIVREQSNNVVQSENTIENKIESDVVYEKETETSEKENKKQKSSIKEEKKPNKSSKKQEDIEKPTSWLD